MFMQSKVTNQGQRSSEINLRTNWNYPNRCGDLDQMLTYIIHKPQRHATLAFRGPQSIFYSVQMVLQIGCDLQVTSLNFRVVYG